MWSIVVVGVVTWSTVVAGIVSRSTVVAQIVLWSLVAVDGLSTNLKQHCLHSLM